MSENITKVQTIPKSKKKFIIKRKYLNIGTLFSGIGSFEHALKRLNIEHKIIFACDINKFVKQSYFENYDIDESKWFDDITKLDTKKFNNKVDIIVGGSPCQSVGWR